MLSTADITLHQLDRPQLARAAVSAIGGQFRWSETDLPATYGVGNIAWTPAVRSPVFLALPLDGESLRTVIQGLLATVDGPFCLLTPTRRRLSASAEGMLHSRGASLIALCEILEVDEEGKFSLAKELAEIVTDSRRRALLVREPRNSSEPYEFRRQGDMWILAYAGKTAFFEDCRGLQLLSRIVANPNKPIHVMDLTTELTSLPIRSIAGSLGERVDAHALVAYKEELAGLQNAIEDAKQLGDLASHDELCRQRDLVLAEISRSTGLGGRRRIIADTDRIRRQVKMAISRALARIKKSHAELARHLQQAVQTGQTICYLPVRPIPWVI